MPIIDYTPAQTVSPYADLVNKELTDLMEAGEGKATEVKVPTVDAGKFKLVFSQAANAKGKTARYRVQESDGKTRKEKDADGNTVEVPTGETRFVITLSPKHAPRRGRKPAAESGDNTDAQ